MLRIVRLTETITTDVLVEIDEGQDAEDIVSAIQNAYDFDTAKSGCYDSDYKDITDEFGFKDEKSMKSFADITYLKKDYRMEDLSL